ncbi:MAG: VOC family protein [Lautropia sp.]
MAAHELFPYLIVRDAPAAIAFYTAAFGAVESFRLTEPSGRVGHAELMFGPGMTVMIADEFPEYGLGGPAPGTTPPVSLHLHVDDCDAWIERACKAGATVTMPAQDQFYGERSGVIVDPFGHRWNIGHAIETVTPEEMQRRYTKLLGS